MTVVVPVYCSNHKKISSTTTATTPTNGQPACLPNCTASCASAACKTLPKAPETATPIAPRDFSAVAALESLPLWTQPTFRLTFFFLSFLPVTHSPRASDGHWKEQLRSFFLKTILAILAAALLVSFTTPSLSGDIGSDIQQQFYSSSWPGHA